MAEACCVTWDYAAGLATEWRREGECSRCGDCCRPEIRYQGKTARDGMDSTDGAGIWSECDINEGRRLYRLVSVVTEGMVPCPHLQTDGGCSCYADRDFICQDWPTSPAEVEPFPRCTYRFVKVNEWAIQ